MQTLPKWFSKKTQFWNVAAALITIQAHQFKPEKKSPL
jgi:hypothetical protein